MVDYSYDSKWRKIRNKRIKADPLCAHCLAEGFITPGQEVDHIVARRDGGRDEYENTQTLCKKHHRLKTDEENRRWFSKS